MKALAPYAGSKRRLLKHYLGFFPTDQHFLDLFAGSGIVSANATAPSKHLNDINQRWLEVLQTAVEDTDNFVDAYIPVAEFVQDRDTYFVLLDKLPSLTGLDYTASHLVLQSCAFGNIPNQNKEGHFRQGYGSRRKTLEDPKHIYEFAEGLKDATFTARHWDCVPFRGFVFADPPYRTYYEDAVSYNQEIIHEDLAEALKAHGSFAYCGTDLGDGWLDEHFAGYNRVEVPIKHTAKRASVDAVKEVLVYA